MALVEKTFNLKGRNRDEAAVVAARISDPLTIALDPDGRGGCIFLDQDIRIVGRITNKHWISRDLIAGRKVLHASVNCIQGIPADLSESSMTVRVIIGDEGDTYVQPPVIGRLYHVNVVGESFYQSAIAACLEGESVQLVHEPTNPYDRRAIAVISQRGDKIGHLPARGWLTSAILDQGKICTCSIATIHRANPDFENAAVVLLADISGSGDPNRWFA